MSTPENYSGINENLSHSVQSWPGHRLHLYLVPFVLLPLLLFVTALFVVPTRWLAMRSGNSYLANLGYGLTLSNASCQVLISGDSSAMVSVNPAILTEITGLTACNIAEFEGMTLVSGTSILDHFLAHNRRPRFLVLMYAPEDLTIRKSWAEVSTFEAISYRLEHERNLQTADVLATHPAQAFAWAEQGLRLAILRLHTQPIDINAARLRVPSGGQLRLSGHQPLTKCEPLAVKVDPDRQWLAKLRERYAVQGTTVLIDATPAPTCEPHLAATRMALAGAVDNLPYPTLPVTDYVSGGRLHVAAEGSRAITQMIASQIVAHLPSGPGRH